MGPDSSLDGVEQRLLDEGAIDTYQSVREDEGIAFANDRFIAQHRNFVADLDDDAVVVNLASTEPPPDPSLMSSGNPYGASWVSKKSAAPDDDALHAARVQGTRLAQVAAKLIALLSARNPPLCFSGP